MLFKNKAKKCLGNLKHSSITCTDYTVMLICIISSCNRDRHYCSCAIGDGEGVSASMVNLTINRSEELTVFGKVNYKQECHPRRVIGGGMIFNAQTNGD